LADISLSDIPIGDGKVTIRITDLESKVNINVAGPDVLQQGLTLMGVDAGEASSVADCILDWIDQDNGTHLNGVESSYYEGLDPPYSAKNGPLDDLSELLLIRGVTEEMYWGSTSKSHIPAAFQKFDHLGQPMEVSYAASLRELFTPISSGRVNINTASAVVLRMIPGMDETAVSCIMQQREEMPFANVGELATCVGPQAMPAVQRLCTVRSSAFEVEVDASIGAAKRTFHAIVGRNNQRDIQVLNFYWE
jgi:general secretion pathway protein K